MSVTDHKVLSNNHESTSTLEVSSVTEVDNGRLESLIFVGPDDKKPQDPNLVTWDGPDDPCNPQNWSVQYKWFVTLLASLTTVNVTYASSAVSTATGTIGTHFGQPAEVGYLITAIFLFGYVFGPLVWGPGSEVWGRRPIFVISFCCHVVFLLGQALAHNIETLLVTRFIAGFFASAPLASGGGILSDLWDPTGRVASASVLLTCVFLGPALGPIVGGFIEQSGISWRWNFWVTMIFSGTCALIVLFFWPETYESVLLQKKAVRLRKANPKLNSDLYAQHEREDWSFRGILKRTLYRPIEMLMMDPILVFVIIYMSIVYGILYGLFEAIPVVFIVRRGFSADHSGLIFIGVGVGVVIGGFWTLYLSRHYPELQEKWKGCPPPEERLYGAMYAGPLLVVGIFWMGWTGEYKSVPWYVPALATIPIGASVNLVFISFLSYITDTYLMYTASAFSMNMIVRSLFGASFPLFTTQMFVGMGINWACTLLGLISVILIPMPMLFYKYGPGIRAKSKYAPGLDLLIAQEMKGSNKEAEGRV